jgi:hypothetical protein
MITTARHMRDLRPDDIEIEDLACAGLPRPCVIRLARLATFEWSDRIPTRRHAARSRARRRRGAAPAVVRHLTGRARASNPARSLLRRISGPPGLFLLACEAVHKDAAGAWVDCRRSLATRSPCPMTPIPQASLRPARLLGLMTPLAVVMGVLVLLLLPNLVMHTGLRSHASAVSLLGSGAASQSAAAAVESPPVMR